MAEDEKAPLISPSQPQYQQPLQQPVYQAQQPVYQAQQPVYQQQPPQQYQQPVYQQQPYSPQPQQQQPYYPPAPQQYQQQVPPAYPGSAGAYPPQQPPQQQQQYAPQPGQGEIGGGSSQQAPPPPSFADAVSGAQMVDANGAPPDYFDFALIPAGNVVTPQTAPPIDGLSNVKKDLESDGSVSSCDERLDTNANEVWRFFASNLQSPGLVVRIHGYHTETRTRSRTVQRDGHSHVEYENYTETVTDFDIQLDASHYVQNQWTRIVDVGGTSLRETMDEYANSTNYFKEITMQKQVQWDLNAITKAIVFTVRSAGFRRSVDVSYNLPGKTVRVYSSNMMNKMAHNTCVKVLCVVTCLCIVFAPIYYLSRKKISRIIVEYPMKTNENQFFINNHANIFVNVVLRTKVGTITAN